MSKSPTINALRRKRAEIAGQIRELDARIHDLRRDQGHIDATLKLFDPNEQPRLIKPVRPYRPSNRIFERKEVRIRVTNMLREAEGAPMTTEAIAARIVADKGLDAAAEPMVRRVAIIALNALRKSGAAAHDKASGGWTITP
jgi:hypothetical protein